VDLVCIKAVCSSALRPTGVYRQHGQERQSDRTWARMEGAQVTHTWPAPPATLIRPNTHAARTVAGRLHLHGLLPLLPLPLPLPLFDGCDAQ
jgi:hypothetical protein